MSRKRKSFTAEFKAKCVLELLEGGKTQNVIASKYDILPRSLQQWKKQFLSNASLAFDKSTVVKEYKEEIENLSKEKDKIAKKLGEVIVERDWLEAKLSSLDLSIKRKIIDKSEGIQASSKNPSLNRQSKLLHISKTAYYYKPVIPFSSKEDKTLLDVIDKIHTKYPYLLNKFKNDNGQAEVTTPNQVWSGNITYIRLEKGYAYLAAIIDWHTKKIFAWKLSNTMDVNLTTSVLKEALALYPKPKIFNSVQGSHPSKATTMQIEGRGQYSAKEHTDILKQNNISISMDAKGRSIDNILIERFFRTLKYEDVYPASYKTIKEARIGIAEYIQIYNQERLHSTLNYKTPNEVYYKGVNNKSYDAKKVLLGVA